MEFSQKLKNLRENKGISQEELANRIFVLPRVIESYESGRLMPRRGDIEKLAIYFNVELDYFNSDEQVKRSLKPLRKAVPPLGIIVNILYILFFFFPLIRVSGYIYPIPEGQNQPSWGVLYYDSILKATLRHNNPIGFITLGLCLIDLSLFIYYLLLEKNKKMKAWVKYSAVTLLFVNIVMIFITFVVLTVNNLIY